ncbi:hypothetical protein niasHT_038676 [Heterodera trifolii]|uniref:Uncharacterized protein n=1 Tax=Heterodera trifolii TaxID=157864 RepID=A0ABD2HYE9_9BILA
MERSNQERQNENDETTAAIGYAAIVTFFLAVLGLSIAIFIYVSAKIDTVASDLTDKIIALHAMQSKFNEQYNELLKYYNSRILAAQSGFSSRYDLLQLEFIQIQSGFWKKSNEFTECIVNLELEFKRYRISKYWPMIGALCLCVAIVCITYALILLVDEKHKAFKLMIDGHFNDIKQINNFFSWSKNFTSQLNERFEQQQARSRVRFKQQLTNFVNVRLDFDRQFQKTMHRFAEVKLETVLNKSCPKMSAKFFTHLFNSARPFSTSCCRKELRELWKLDKRNPFQEIPEAWVTSLDDVEQKNCGLIQLHPGMASI